MEAEFILKRIFKREPGQAGSSKFTSGVPDAIPTTQMEIKKENIPNKDGARDYYSAFPERVRFQVFSKFFWNKP